MTTMIEIVPPHLYSAYGRDLAEMHRLRHRVFKERLGWDVRSENGMERDDFDDLEPTYFLAFDDERALVGVWRVLPTTGATMIGTTFSVLLGDRELPSSPELWECSRFAVDFNAWQRSPLFTVNRITCELMCALGEFCFAEGIVEIVTVYDKLVERLMRKVGIAPYWQGSYHQFGKTQAVAGFTYITSDLVDEIRRRGGISGSVMASMQWRESPLNNPHHARGVAHV
jgi:acyl homoserine lactone synthase